MISPDLRRAQRGELINAEHSLIRTNEIYQNVCHLVEAWLLIVLKIFLNEL